MIGIVYPVGVDRWRWRLESNGQVVARSTKTYGRSHDAQRGFRRVVEGIERQDWGSWAWEGIEG